MTLTVYFEQAQNWSWTGQKRRKPRRLPSWLSRFQICTLYRPGKPRWIRLRFDSRDSGELRRRCAPAGEQPAITRATRMRSRAVTSVFPA